MFKAFQCDKKKGEIWELGGCVKGLEARGNIYIAEQSSVCLDMCVVTLKMESIAV